MAAKSAKFASRSCESIHEVGRTTQHNKTTDVGIKRHALTVKEVCVATYYNSSAAKITSRKLSKFH